MYYFCGLKVEAFVEVFVEEFAHSGWQLGLAAVGDVACGGVSALEVEEIESTDGMASPRFLSG